MFAGESVSVYIAQSHDWKHMDSQDAAKENSGVLSRLGLGTAPLASSAGLPYAEDKGLAAVLLPRPPGRSSLLPPSFYS